MKLSQISDSLSAVLYGNSDCDVSGISPLSTAKKGELTFLLDKKFITEALNSSCDAFVSFKHIPELSNQIVVSHPKKALAQVIDLFFPEFSSYSFENAAISPSAVIHPSAIIESDVAIGPFSHIGAFTHIQSGASIGSHVSIGAHCVVGKSSRIHPHVSLYDHVILEDNVIIHSGSVIGSDGFGYYQDKGVSHKIQQIGNVIIHSESEIGANTVIDRACLGSTVIGERTKIDNLVQIAHNVSVGHDSIITSQVGLVGSSVLGHHVTIGGQSGVDAVHVGNHSLIAARSGVTKDVPEKSIVSGFPAWPHHMELKKEATIRKLIQKKDIS